MEKCTEISAYHIKDYHYYDEIIEKYPTITMDFCQIHLANSTSNKRRIRLYIDGNQIGYFELSGVTSERTKQFVEFFDTGEPIQCSIEIEDTILTRNQGFSKLMIGMMCICIKELSIDEGGYPEIRNDQIITIDTDASNGFWEIVGFKPSRYNERNTGSLHREDRYEASIEFVKLFTWATSKSKGKGIKSKKKKRKSRKNKSRKNKSRKNKSRKNKSK